MKAFISFFIILLSFSLHAKEVRCKLLFHTDERVSQAVRAFQKGKQDTTSLRQEVKFVVKTEELNKYLKVLENYFGDRFKNRDKAPDGFANITSTKYMTVAKYVQNGKKLSAKIRFRKYYTRELSDVNWQRLKVSPDLADRAWLELKIQHPDFDNVVFKPRLLVYDKDAEKLINEEYFDYKDSIIKRLKELNPGKDEDIAKFIAYFDALYTTPAMRVQNLFANTAYERISYSTKLNRTDTPTEKIDVQITLDQTIRLKRLKDNKDFNAYGDDETVVEVKIPVQFARLDRSALEAIPELTEFKKFIEWLDTNHVSKYPKNKGKMSKIDKKIDEDIDDDYD